MYGLCAFSQIRKHFQFAKDLDKINNTNFALNFPGVLSQQQPKVL